jgi:cation diffusion facilitator family transporter
MAGAELSAELQRYSDARRVTLIGSAFDLVLGVVKIVIGVTGHSQALIADGVHSLSDLATDFMVLFAMKHGSRAADGNHPYGHERIETAMTVGLGIVLILVALGIAYDAIVRLFEPERLLHPGALALSIAVISIITKEAIYHYTVHYARKFNSRLLRANAWHSRSDAISSVIVAVGVIGSMAGLSYLDAIAAVGVALMISKIGWDLAWSSLQELVDTGLERKQIDTIRGLILATDGVRALHSLRTRRMGGNALADVHIQVEPKLSVSEGHHIAESVRRRLLEASDDVNDVTVHIDPENDERSAASMLLPDRSAVLSSLRKKWHDAGESSAIRDIRLHYLNGQLHVELLLSLEEQQSIAQAQAAVERLSRLISDDPQIADVQVRFQ